MGRMRASNSNSVRSSSSAFVKCSGRYDEPRRLQATRSAFGATAAVGSIWRNAKWWTTSSRLVERGASRSCALTAIRRACRFVSACTSGALERRAPPADSLRATNEDVAERRIGESDQRFGPDEAEHAPERAPGREPPCRGDPVRERHPLRDRLQPAGQIRHRDVRAGDDQQDAEEDVRENGGLARDQTEP